MKYLLSTIASFLFITIPPVHAQEKFTKEQWAAFHELKEIHSELEADALMLIDKLNQPSQCYGTLSKLKGYQAMKKEDYIFDNATLIKRLVICYDNEKAIVNNSDSVYAKFSNSIFMSFNRNKTNTSELAEIIQINHQDKKLFYSKNVIMDNSMPLSQINGASIFVSNFVKLK